MRFLEFLNQVTMIMAYCGVILTALGTIVVGFLSASNRAEIRKAIDATDKLHQAVNSALTAQKSETQDRENVIRELSVNKAVTQEKEVSLDATRTASEASSLRFETMYNEMVSRVNTLESRILELNDLNKNTDTNITKSKDAHDQKTI